MKIKSILLAALIAFGFAACNNEDVPKLPEGAEATVSLKVVPASNGSTRATGDLSSDGLLAKGLEAEYDVMKTQVWIFGKEESVLIGYGENGTETDVVDNIPALAVESDILIVVNGVGLGATTTRSELEGLHAIVPTDIAGKGLVMTGLITETLEVGGNAIGYTATEKVDYKILSSQPAKVTRVNARVGFVDIKLALAAEQQHLFTDLKDLEVAIFNVPKQSNIFGDALAENAYFLFGAEDNTVTNKWPSSQDSYVGANVDDSLGNAALFDKLGDTWPDAGADAAYYYVTENTATDVKEQMLIVLRGKPNDGTNNVTYEGIYTDGAGFTYYPVWVNATKDGYTYTDDLTVERGTSKVLRNTQYNISLTIKGIGNPSIDPVDKAWLDVKVEVADWLQVGQNVEWK